MPKCKHAIVIEDIKSLKKYLKKIGNDYFDKYAENGLEEYIKFELSRLYLYNKYKIEFPSISIEEYDGKTDFTKECNKSVKDILKDSEAVLEKENNKSLFEKGCESQYERYVRKEYIIENQNSNINKLPTPISLVSIIYFISRIVFLDWVKDAKLNENKYYVPIAFVASILLFSTACALILHAAGISTIPFLKGVDLPANANIITFLPIHFGIAIVFAVIATAFCGIGVHKLNNVKTIENKIETVFHKVKHNPTGDTCLDCNNRKFPRYLVSISAACATSLLFIAFILQVQANLQINNSDPLGIQSYLKDAPLPLQLGTLICMAIAICLVVFSIYKYNNKAVDKSVNAEEKELQLENTETKNQREKQPSNDSVSCLGQSIAKQVINVTLPKTLIDSVNKSEVKLSLH